MTTTPNFSDNDTVGGANPAVNDVFIGHVTPAAALPELSNVTTLATAASTMRVFTGKDVKFLVSAGKRVRFTKFIAADGATSGT